MSITIDWKGQVWATVKAKLGGSSALAANKFVYVTAADTVEIASGGTQKILGFVAPKEVSDIPEIAAHIVAVTENDRNYTAGDTLGIMMMGEAEAIATGGITVDDWLEVSASGGVQVWSGGTHQCVGRAKETVLTGAKVKFYCNTFYPAESSPEINNQNLTNNGAITFASLINVCMLNKSSAIAATLANPTESGHILLVNDQTGKNHTITFADASVYTFPAVIGASLLFVSIGTAWFRVNQWEPASQVETEYTTNGAIAFGSRLNIVDLNKSAGALAMTLATPTVSQVGVRIIIVNKNAQAHVITSASLKLNGVHNTLTITSGANNTAELVAVEYSTGVYGWIVIGGTLSTV